MPTMDIFNADAFSTFSMLEAVEKVPFQPNLLGSLGIFEDEPIRTEAIGIEERAGVLSLIQTSQRGAPLGQRDTEKRKLRDFRTSRIAKSSTIYAHEVQNIRAMGNETELMSVQGEVARRLAGPTGLMRDVELTHENMRLGAIQGIVTDADDSVIYNWYDEFDVAQPTEIDFDLDAASPASGVIRGKCSTVVRQMMRAAGGAFLPSTRVMGLCGDTFWDQLTGHSEVRQTYLNTMEAKELRAGNAFESFSYGGITWVNYRGTDDASTVAVTATQAKFFPVGAPGVFKVAWSPLESMEMANTLGMPVYPVIVRDLERDFWVKVEAYSYPLFVCTRPLMLQRAKNT